MRLVDAFCYYNKNLFLSIGSNIRQRSDWIELIGYTLFITRNLNEFIKSKTDIRSSAARINSIESVEFWRKYRFAEREFSLEEEASECDFQHTRALTHYG